MTNKEILQADLLDILFEHRNKAYGAYALRKNYNQRLQLALIISLGAALVLVLINFGKEAVPGQTPVPPDLVIHTVNFTKNKPREAEPSRARIQPPRRQTTYVSRIAIVDDRQRVDVPTKDQIDPSSVSAENVSGIESARAVEPIHPESTGGNPKGTQDETEERVVFRQSDAQFPGGIESFKKFLTKNLVTPDDLQVEEKKTVLVRFKVDVDGSISNTEILQSGGDKYDREVLRVLHKMPKWVPATQNGVKVATWFTQPVSFIGVE